MGAPAVVLIGDSNFFNRTDGGLNVYEMVKNSTVQQAAVYGIWIRKLSQTPQKIEEFLQYLQSLGASEVMLALCAGQRDVLDGKGKEAISAVPRLTQLVEKYDAHLVVTELFDHTTFAQSQPKYAKGVEDSSWAWKHEFWTDAKMQCLGTHIIADVHIISDQMHLTVKGRKMIADNLAAKVRALALPRLCLS